MFRRFFLLVILGISCEWGFSQSLSEIFLHFSEDELEVPMEVRHKMIYNKGNTLINYDGYALKVYDKRAKFIQVITPLKHTYEIATWKLTKKDVLVALCETDDGSAKQSTLRFYLPQQNWKALDAGDFIPDFSLEDIFSTKKLEKNYLTIKTLLPDLQVKTQFFLPQSGHDIIVVFTCLDELEKSEFKRIYKYLDGTMLDLEWAKGKGQFVKGPAYFLVN